jgi:hypothetical protein
MAAEGLSPTIAEAVMDRWNYLCMISNSGHVRFEAGAAREGSSSAEMIDE